MPCGRIIVSAFLPGVILFGEKRRPHDKLPLSLPAILIGFILCGAASCGPSPFGGLGGIGEGNLGLRVVFRVYHNSLELFWVFLLPLFLSDMSASLPSFSDCLTFCGTRGRSGFWGCCERPAWLSVLQAGRHPGGSAGGQPYSGVVSDEKNIL